MSKQKICKHKRLMVYSAEKMPSPKRYDTHSGITSTHYVQLTCRDCGFVLNGAGCIYLPEAFIWKRLKKMKVTENFDVPIQITSALRKREFRPRNYSVTKLICCPRKTYFAMTGKHEIILDETQLIFARGRAHHSILEVYPLKEVARKRDSEVFRDGEPIPIYGDIDMIGERITEIFTTTLSSGKIVVPDDAIKTFPTKVKQLRAYDFFEGECQGDLLVFFLFGDYKRFEEVAGKKVYVGLRPKLRCFTYEFTKEDLLEVWQLMNQNLADIEHGKKTGIPPLTIGEKWECDNCGYSYICFGEEPVTEAVQGDIK